MSIIFKTDVREVIPKIRKSRVAIQNGELEISSSKVVLKTHELETLNLQKENYLRNKNLKTAGDLIGSAYVLGLENEFKEVAKFILQTETKNNSILANIAHRILNEKSTSIPKQKEEINDEIGVKHEIAKYRNHLKNEPKNPIAWAELGRLYFICNKIEKATKCFKNAVQLDKNNRFIVRTASRFYHHIFPQSTLALDTIKKSDFVKHDPYLMSAEIAFSSLYDKHSITLKKGIELLNNKNLSQNYTELASAVGTKEYNSGKLKIAKDFLKLSLINPNDNTIAQAFWMSEKKSDLNISIDINIPKTAFEANSIKNFENEHYEEAFKNAKKWIDDEPYSSRPIKLASYLASIFLNNNEEAVEIINKGLDRNSNDILLNNDAIYYLIRQNKIEEANKIFNSKIKQNIDNSLDEITKLTLSATTGLLMYKNGNQIYGKNLYLNSITRAKKIDNKYLLALATVNFINEEIEYVNSINELENHIDLVKEYMKNKKSHDIRILFKSFEEKIKRST